MAGFAYFGHLAGFIGLAAANRTFADLIFEHWVVVGAAAPKLLARDHAAEVHHQKRHAYKPYRKEQNIQKFHVFIL